MKRREGDLSQVFHALATGAHRLRQTASLQPSSKFLARALVKKLPLEDAKCVIALGPGLQEVTRLVLARLPPDAHVHAIEADDSPAFVRGGRLDDPRLRPLHGTAAEAASLLRHDGCLVGTDAIISSMRLSTMPSASREEVLGAASDVLKPGGRFVQVQYAHARAISFQPGEGLGPFDGEEFLSRWFHDVEARFVALNLPPAFVYTCKRARAIAVAPRRMTHWRLAGAR